jgi:hypothetical protein
MKFKPGDILQRNATGNLYLFLSVDEVHVYMLKLHEERDHSSFPVGYIFEWVHDSDSLNFEYSIFRGKR